jgi:Fic family protein
MNMRVLDGSPYVVGEGAEEALLSQVYDLERRVELLRGEKLTDDTLRRYYDHSRLRDVTESNAIEGSTLSLQETTLAVAKGSTLTGHDPGYVRDAKALYDAFQRLTELARLKEPTDISQVKDIHGRVLGDRPGAGLFRRERVRISGAEHVPPRDWQGVMKGMEEWQEWSRLHPSAPAPLRATVLHAWLAHIHPFIDGNGRTARAITTLELVRGGYPPAIIRKKDRRRYYEALADADQGDLAPMLDLMLARGNDALRELERTAKEEQGYSPVIAALRKKQQNQMVIWNKAVALLIANIEAELESRSEAGGEAHLRLWSPELESEEYIALCQGETIYDSWAFEIRVRVPGAPSITRLAWVGYRSDDMLHALGKDAAQGPTLFWSVLNPSGIVPRWRRARPEEAPGSEEMTYAGDGWVARKGHKVEALGPSDLAVKIAQDLVTLA